MAPIKPDVERRVVRKLDFILLPFLSILFLFNSLDKSNIGSAETGHFTDDVGIPASALNVSVACFFAVFVTLQPVGAALGRKYGMARYVPTCMALWGICTALHAAVRKEWQLILLRTLVGILEAGFYPTTVSYLSLFYTRFEFAKRLGAFYGQAAVAGAFGGLLSWAIFKHFPDPRNPSHVLGQGLQAAGVSPLRSWQVLFLIEGFSTMAIAVVGFFWLPHNAGSAWFLSPEERVCAEARLSVDRAETHVEDDPGEDEDPVKPDDGEEDEHDPRHASISQSSTYSYQEDHRLLRSSSVPESSHTHHDPTDDRGLNRNDIISAFLDWKVWYLLACNILSAIPATAFSVFLPIVIKGLAYSKTDMGETGEMAPATANLLTVPPFVAGAVVLWIFTAWSDKRHERLRPVLWGLVILLVGLAATLLLPRTAYVPRYLALIVLLSGSFVPSPLTVAWLTNNNLQPGKRAVVLGINGWGNLAGVLSALLFAPRYRHSGYILPFFVTLACVGVSFVGFLGFRAAIIAINKARAHLLSDWEPERTEREAKHGDVAVAQPDRDWLERLRGANVPRLGEERLTYQFTL
ncbi:MFS general substrate transporter [Myriangium duriaei CBS 260.36]|uniref:MFS general substrate transporter n=1 Tax=Myriangium duriaei CBS 260.36 TaxID=1168546 RepID=A0A9P4MJ91_9PEZI|nr:MFS general substrate transporter [Myriangium duriaei CBS 260.36]